MANNRMMNELGEIIGIADVMFATTAANSNSPNSLNGSITINLGFAESGEMESEQAEVWGTPGIISVPNLPAKTNNNTDAAQAMYLKTTSQNIAFAFRDTRSQAIAGNINPGETCVYAPAGQARALFKADGTATLITTDDNTATGNNVEFTISPTGLYFKAPWGKITFDATGLHIANSTGARIDLNNIDAPGPLAAVVGNSCTITTSVFNANAGVVNLGPQTGASLPAIYGVVPVVAPGIPILAEGVGLSIVNACASTKVNIGI
jgi:hypothetical protein